jgi:alkylation response protein AidB-like acyl-CoA dehydrogenase
MATTTQPTSDAGNAGDVNADRAHEAFRGRVREFLDSRARRRHTAPAGRGGARAAARLDRRSSDPAVQEATLSAAKTYQAALFDAGLAALTWPTEYGGQGLPSSYQTIFNDENSNYDTPDALYTIGFGMCIPTVLAHGTEAHKQRYVRPAARGEEIWCQLFSEPAAGSDVASLRSQAVRDGDEWVLDGQKVWTSGAHYSDYGIVLARTDPEQPKHRGLSMFILDMHAPGVTVRPLRQLDGGAAFNEVFFDAVRIPADQLMGEPGDGWRIALTTLMNERVAIGAGRSAEKASPLEPISLHLDLARRRGVIDDPIVRQELADLLARFWVLDMVGLRIRASVAAGRIPGPEGSIAKLSGAVLASRSAQLACRLAGPAAAATTAADSGAEPNEDDRDAMMAAYMMLVAPATSIAGGTNEVMRNILGERVLGLPKDPQVDRDIPFRDLPVSG